MRVIRRSDERGKTQSEWLNSRHTFSFGQYLDPNHMGFGPLRVINEDRIAPGAGFDTHGHVDMEILSILLDGALEHRDTMGETTLIRPSDVQRMSAGTGLKHSEINASQTNPVHFLQIWIVPEQEGLKPSYELRNFSREERLNALRLLGSRDARRGSVVIHRDVDLYGSILDRNESVTNRTRPNRGVWVQVIRGLVVVDGATLNTGDGISITDTEKVLLNAEQDCEFLLFDFALT